MYHVRVESHTVFRYYLHDDWRSVVFEQVSTYDVNGVKGYGIFEFLYRSVKFLLSFSSFFWSAFFLLSCCLVIQDLCFLHYIKLLVE